MVIRERYSDHIHSGEILDVLSLNGTLACLLDFRLQSVTINQEMQAAFRLEDTELSFLKWMSTFHSIDQYEIQNALLQLRTGQSRETTVHVTMRVNMESYHCKMVHLTNGQIAFTLLPSPHPFSFRDQSIRNNNETTADQCLSEQACSTGSMTSLIRKRDSQPSNSKGIQVKYRMTNLVDKLPHGLATIGHNWEVIYANSKMEEIFGLSISEPHHRKLWDIHSASEYDHFFQQYLRAIRTREVIDFEGVINKTQKVVKLTIHPTDQGVTIFAQDITSYKKQLQALQESEERFDILANNIKDVFWISDPDFNKIYYISPSFRNLFGIKRREVLKDPFAFTRVVHDSDQERVRMAMEVMKDKNHLVEYQITDTNTKEKWVRTRGFPVVNDGTNYVIGIHEDITEYKEMAQLKEKSQQLSTVTQMSAGIAHEIKNPLTSIKGFLQIGAANPDLRDHYQDIIISEVNRIEEIIQDFMMLSKPRSSIQFEEVDPESMVTYVLRSLEPEADNKNVQLTLMTQFNDQTMITDAKRLNQILVNLIKNAIDAVDDGGKIIISGEQADNDLTFSVRDNGPGLTPDQLSKIGEPFFTTKEKGTGLGVMVTRKMVTDLNGTIDYKSQQGEGTCVTICLPQ